VAVIGAGIAGASVAWHLADHVSVALIERETQPGTHSTGRSAAMVTETSGSPEVAALVAASRPFLASPPDGFCDHDLLEPRGLLWIARREEVGRLEAKMAAAQESGAEVHCHDFESSSNLVEVLRRSAVAAAMLETAAMSIDVAGLLDGFLRGARSRGVTLHTGNGVTALSHRSGRWHVESGSESWDCKVVVNAAGAWCDRLAELGGVKPLGLLPLRRSVFVFPPPAGVDVSSWPMVWDVGDRFYFEPEGPMLLASPADEILSEPCDARPLEEDIALGVQEIEEATTLRVRGVRQTWAGLRTFTADRLPAVGFDPDAEGFFWLAGQGGYGIETSPALGQLAASVILANEVSSQFDKDLVTALDPARFRR